MRLNKTEKSIFRIIALLMLMPVLYFVFMIFTVVFSGFYISEKFDRKRWAEDEENRFRICRDLIHGNVLKDKSKEEVLEILGKTDTATDKLTYYIGFEPGFIVIDPSVLEIDFKDGKVVKISKRRT